VSERLADVLFRLAGSPPQDRAQDVAAQRCRVCAALTERAVPYERWQGSDYTDQNKLRYIAGTHVCEPCVWAHAWNPPPDQPPAAPGTRGVNLRLFSHLYDSRGYRSANKADKALIRTWLCAPKVGPWFCAVADTGQKHVVPWTTPNLDPYVGVVRFEERDVVIDSRITRDWIDATIELLTAGATKAEIEAGVYRPETWLRCGGLVREYEARFGAERGSGWAELTLWLAQRDEEAVAERLIAEKQAKAEKAAKAPREVKNGRGQARSSDRSSRGSVDGSSRGVPRGRRQRAETLGADSRPSEARDADQRENQRVVFDAPPSTQPRCTEQLDLFGSLGVVR
jgi:hypothetical protein